MPFILRELECVALANRDFVKQIAAGQCDALWCRKYSAPNRKAPLKQIPFESVLKFSYAEGTAELRTRSLCSKPSSPHDQLNQARRSMKCKGIVDRPINAVSYGRASNTILNGVSAARRTDAKPPVLITSLSRASPACAPNANPTSCANDVGTQTMVDAA